MLPEVHTSYARKSSVTLEEIDTVQDFVGKLEKIQAPNQLVAEIEDPLLQKYLQLLGSETESERINVRLSFPWGLHIVRSRALQFYLQSCSMTLELSKSGLT
jgi:hypothetical protein